MFRSPAIILIYLLSIYGARNRRWKSIRFSFAVPLNRPPPAMVSPSANWLMFSSRFYRRVSRQSASINYIFAFCASLIIYFFAASTVHAQHNDLYEMIKSKPALRVMKSRIVIMNFRDDSFFQELFNYFAFAASSLDSTRLEIGRR